MLHSQFPHEFKLFHLKFCKNMLADFIFTRVNHYTLLEGYARVLAIRYFFGTKFVPMCSLPLNLLFQNLESLVLTFTING